MFNGISIVCFAASYAVALCLEVSRLFFRVSLRTAIMVGFVLAGLVAHSIYLTREAQQGFTQGAPLSSWYHGCLIVAWLLAVAYVTLSLWKKPTAIGLFFLPTILALVAIAQLFPRQPQLTSEVANRVWSLVHGVALLLGTAAVMVGFLGGVLYLAQSYRLKQKIVASRGLRLPSLEILQRVSEGALIASCCLLLLGLISGILLNWQPGEESAVPWNDPVIWPSGVLLLWLLAALSFNAIYKPARQGRKVAYLTMASFIFLGLVLAILLLVPSSHGASGRMHEAETSRGSVQGWRVKNLLLTHDRVLPGFVFVVQNPSQRLAPRITHCATEPVFNATDDMPCKPRVFNSPARNSRKCVNSLEAGYENHSRRWGPRHAA